MPTCKAWGLHSSKCGDVTMDINDLRSLTTVVAFAVFLGIVAWAYSDRRKQEFDQAASLVLDDDSTPLVPSADGAAAPKTERK